MRILIVAQVPMDRPFGAARHLHAVSRELASLNHEVLLLAPGRNHPPHVQRIRSPSFLHPGVRMEAANALLASVTSLQRRPEVAYVRLSASSSAVPLALAALSIPVVLELNGRILAELRQLGRGPLAQRIVQYNLRAVVQRARALVAVDEKIGRHAKEELGAEQVEVIENGADLDVATPGDRNEARRRLGWDPDRRYLALTGTLAPELRLDLLIEAHRHLSDDVTLVVAGGGAQQERMARYAQADRIQYLGTLQHEEAIDVIRAADVCVNVRDGDLGMKCLEYAAVGKRFVSFQVEGSERLAGLYPNEAGVFLVEERSAEALAKAIEQALAQERPLSPQAVNHARSLVGWGHTARQLDALFTRVTMR